jgi:hypothetical protein
MPCDRDKKYGEIFYVTVAEAERMENRGSILRDFVAGKSQITFKASALMHFIHRSALHKPAVLKSSMVIL